MPLTPENPQKDDRGGGQGGQGGRLHATRAPLSSSVIRTGSFYFMEMNTRLQVEHSVTEMVTGHRYCQVADPHCGRRAALLSTRRISAWTGHAIECRINAENPDQNFRPSCGRITLLHIPGGPWVRFDTALYQDYFDAALLRFDDRQADRLRPDPRGGHPQDAGGAVRAGHRGRRP